MDIDSNKMVETSVVCNPGRKIKNIENTITNYLSIDDKHKIMTLLVGGNQCDTTSPTSVADIVDSYDKMIDDIISKVRNFADSTSSVIRLWLKNTKRALRHVPFDITSTFEEL